MNMFSVWVCTDWSIATSINGEFLSNMHSNIIISEIRFRGIVPSRLTSLTRIGIAYTSVGSICDPERTYVHGIILLEWNSFRKFYMKSQVVVVNGNWIVDDSVGSVSSNETHRRGVPTTTMSIGFSKRIIETSIIHGGNVEPSRAAGTSLTQRVGRDGMPQDRKGR